MSDIGTLNEGSLHAALKKLYAQPGDEFEVPLDRFVIDIKRGSELIEVQTVSFASMGKKLDHLLPDYQILLVHPIAVATYLDRPGKNPRKSPKRGSIYSLFEELVSVPTLIDHPNLTIEALLVSVNKTQVEDPTARRGRGGFRTVNRSLRAIHSTHRFETAGDLPKDRTIDFQCVGWVGSFSSLRSLELFDLPGIQIRDGSFLNQF